MVYLAECYQSLDQSLEAKKLLKQLPLESDMDGYVIEYSRKIKQRCGPPIPKD